MDRTEGVELDVLDTGVMTSGHLACQGCGAPIAMRHVLTVLGKKTVIVLPACCYTIIAGPFPYSGFRIPVYHTAFETAASCASGIRAAFEVKKKKGIQVVAWAGDGGTFDIGIQALSGAAERNDDFIYVCYDNEAYMNTGIQRSSATPKGAWTTTTPERHPKIDPKKNIVEIMAAHRIPYAATASVAYPEDLKAKVRKAKQMKGTRFLHILSPCPAGWRYSPELTIKLARMAVDCKAFPIYEVLNGTDYRMTVEPKGTPVADYVKLQGRFKHLSSEGVEEMQKNVDVEWRRLLARVEACR
jgi:pyruvate ferredoxin oxidoreductase beta subunit/2-oxoisovalerate ferredoxin oxidoreductase beta subunit